MEKKLDIRKKYSIEVIDIENKLYDLQKKVANDNEARNIIAQIYKMLQELREKIEYNKISDVEILQKCCEKAMDKRNWK